MVINEANNHSSPPDVQRNIANPPQPDHHIRARTFRQDTGGESTRMRVGSSK